MTLTTERPIPRDSIGGDPPFVMHIVRRDPVTKRPGKIALCGKKTERPLGGRPANSIICEACERIALQGWGGTPTR